MRPLAVLALALSAALAIGACGGTSSQNSASTAAGNGALTSAGEHNGYLSEGEHKGYLNDGDSEREEGGDGDSDNRADTDKDASLDYLPRDYQPNENSRYHDADDDRGIVNYGHAVAASDARTIAALVERYYAAAAAGNGLKACSMLAPTLASAVPVDYGQYGPSYLHGAKTCATVLDLLFAHYHRQLAAPMAVTNVRAEGTSAYALLGSAGFPASYIIVKSEGHAWRVAQLLGNENILP